MLKLVMTEPASNTHKGREKLTQVHIEDDIHRFTIAGVLVS